MSTSFTVWSDDPISDSDSDKLDIEIFVDALVDHLRHASQANSSIVYSLVGPWGSGKSSILNLISNSLMESQGGGWSIARFTPWATSSTDGLLQEFFASIISAIPGSSDDARAARAKNKIAKLLEICSPGLKAIPVAGGAASEYAKFFSEQLTERHSWEREFSDASNSLADLNRRVLILVDDIDRLHSSELLELMRVIRLLGRFPGVSYLLAYDEEVLCRNVVAASGGQMSITDARRYLEKIIQYPFYIPPIQQSQIFDLLSDGLDAVVEQTGHSVVEDDGRRISSVARVISRSLGTIRSLNRVLEQVRIDLKPHEPGEVSVVDVFLLALLRHISPEVHDKLREFKSILVNSTAGTRQPVSFATTPGSNVSTVDNLVDLADPGVRADVRLLIGQIFPQAVGQISVEGSANLIRNAQYFDRYIYKKIPEGDVSDSSVRSWLRACEMGEKSAFRVGISGRDSTTQSVIFSKVQQFLQASDFGEAWGHWAFPMLLEALPAVSDQRRGFFTPRELFYQLADEALHNALENVWRSGMPPLCIEDLDPRDIVGMFNSILTTGEEMRPWGGMQKRCLDRLFFYAEENLKAGDSAERRSDIGYFLFLIAESPGVTKVAEYASRVRELIISETVSLDTLASRFVGTRTEMSSGESTLSSFNESGFRHWAPEEITWPEDYNGPIQSGDLSWENRKLFARREATRYPNGFLGFEAE